MINLIKVINSHLCRCKYRFEQYRDLFVNLGLSVHLMTQELKSASLRKKTENNFSKLRIRIEYDKRNRAFMPTSGSNYHLIRVSFYADKQFIKNTFAVSGYKELTT